jgi:hypothetical protein
LPNAIVTFAESIAKEPQHPAKINVMTKQKSIDEIEAGWNGLDRPKSGQVFQHYKGGKYEIVATGFLEDSETPCVVYRSLEKDIVWVRTAKNFLEQVEHQGIVRARFKLI